MKNEYQLLNKQKMNPGNNQICKLDNKNKENQYQCDLFIPKRGVWGLDQSPTSAIHVSQQAITAS